MGPILRYMSNPKYPTTVSSDDDVSAGYSLRMKDLRAYVRQIPASIRRVVTQRLEERLNREGFSLTSASKTKYNPSRLAQLFLPSSVAPGQGATDLEVVFGRARRSSLAAINLGE